MTSALSVPKMQPVFHAHWITATRTSEVRPLTAAVRTCTIPNLLSSSQPPHVRKLGEEEVALTKRRRWSEVGYCIVAGELR
jgi:hypothetical protein